MLATAVLLAGCGDAKPGAPEEAVELAATVSGDAKGAAADNPQCAMFNRDEIAALSGEPVEVGRNAASGLGCQWSASDASGSSIVTVAPASYHVETSEAPGYRALPEVGTKGFVAGKTGGWTAGTIAGDKALIVSIDGDRTSEANVIALLQQTVAKVTG